MYAPSVDNLIVQLARLPGVGRRTAQRLAFHLLKASDADALALADAIREVKERIGFCTECGNLAEEPLCQICADARRDRSLICVVEDPSDLVALERTHEYRGLYHVLGGALSPIDGVDPENLRIAELVARVERGGVAERATSKSFAAGVGAVGMNARKRVFSTGTLAGASVSANSRRAASAPMPSSVTVSPAAACISAGVRAVANRRGWACRRSRA